MKVSDLFESERLTKDHLDTVTELSDYWVKCAAFVREKWNEDIERLSPKQAKWMTDIHDDMVVMRIEHKI